ncbi:glycosyltransferase [Spirillospora sp. CA-253888]
MASVDIAIPVLNEERALSGCVRTLHAFLHESFPLPWRLTIVDNGSTDRTWEIATGLSQELDGVHARRLEVRGKGAAVKAAWADSPADIVAYMDVDLSTGLGALLPLIAPLASGHSELAIGTRLGNGARIRRGLRREAVSRCYNGLLRAAFGARFSDAACGFKAARAETVRPLLAKAADDGWFFDSELLLLAEHNGLRIHEVPVDWIEDTDSRVRVAGTSAHNLRGMVRTARAMASGAALADLPPRPELRPAHPDAVVAPRRGAALARFVSFAVIGGLSTGVHAGLYALLRAFWDPAAANLAALLLCAIANTEANRRWTFRHDGPRTGAHLRAGALLVLTYLVTSAAVLMAPPALGRAGETATLVAAALLMTVLRFAALDRWVFARRRP